MATAAAERRWAAMRAMSDTVVSRDTGVYLITDAEVIAERIESLAPLGRTDRWHGAIAAWADAVRDPERRGDLEYLHWAFAQYSVYASYSAE